MEMNSTARRTATDDVNKLIQRRYGESPRERLDYIKHFSMASTDGFNPDEISWINDRIGVTDLVGAFVATAEGNFVINVAGETDSPCAFKEPVDPRVGPEALRETLDRIADEMHNVIETTDKKVVVHCYMGMERSVLSVVWYLHRYEGKTIDAAYQIVANVRPIAIDHRSWIEA
jgi:hypothetical protein